MFRYYLKVALHNTRRNKVLTALMVLAIAVGIGASMTTLTVMHLLSGDPLPGRSGEIFYPQVDPDPESKGREPYDVLDYRTAYDLWSARRADQQTMVSSNPMKVGADDAGSASSMRSVLSTTSDFFSMFNVPMRYGRAWSDQEDAGRARVAVISSLLNQQLFGGKDSVGETIRIRDRNVRIVGVMGAWRPSPLFYKIRGGRFSAGDTSSFYGAPDDVFMPFSTSLEVNAGGFQPFTCWATPENAGDIENAPCVSVGVWVRLDTPQKVSDYTQFVANYAAEQKALGRIGHADNTRMRSLMQWLDFNKVVPSDVKLQTVLAFAFLVICLANVVGLLLAKFMRHGSEIGLRRALGASRWAVFLQCLIESAVIGMIGGAGGLLLTLIGLSFVRSLPVAYADLTHLNLPMFLATFALSLLASLVAGAIPAIRASAVQPVAQLKLL